MSAVAAEVTNTPWRERHAYVLDVTATTDHGSASLISGRSQKQLHVSPLMAMGHVYEWRLTEPGERLAVHIESLRSHAGAVPSAAESAFDATLALRRREMSRGSMAGALAAHPLLSVRMVAAIYGHALRLRLKGARYHAHPSTAAPSR